MRCYFFIIFVLFQILVSGNLYADNNKFDERLGLTKEQKEKIKNLIIENRSKKEKFVVDLKIKQLELRSLLMESDFPSKEEVKSKLKEISEIEVEIRLLRYELDIEILKILNDKQRKKYKYFRLQQRKEEE